MTLCDPVDGSPPVSSVHGIFQATVLEWVAMSSSNRIRLPDPGIKTYVSCVSCVAGGFLTIESPGKPFLYSSPEGPYTILPWTLSISLGTAIKKFYLKYAVYINSLLRGLNWYEYIFFSPISAISHAVLYFSASTPNENRTVFKSLDAFDN